MGRTLQRLTLCCAGLLLGACAGELVARRALGVGQGWYDEEQVRAELLELRGRSETDLPMPGDATKTSYKAAAKHVVHPFVGFDSPHSNRQLSVELRDFTERDPTRLRVVLLGGSVAGIFGRLGGELLTEKLEASPLLEGREVDLLLYGRGGFKQPQHLIRVVELLSFGVKPDLVINLDGFNEVALGANNVAAKLYPGFPAYAQWLPLVHSSQNRGAVLDAYSDVRRASQALKRALDAWLESELTWSATYTFLAKRNIARAQGRQGAAREAYFALLDESELEPSLLGPHFEGGREEAARLSVQIWSESSVQLSNLCAANGIDYVHILQPTLYDKGAKPITEKEREKAPLPKHWEVGVHYGYPLLREAGTHLAERGVAFFDASRIFQEVDESLYYDACHFGQQGNDLLAEFVAQRVLQTLAEK